MLFNGNERKSLGRACKRDPYDRLKPPCPKDKYCARQCEIYYQWLKEYRKAKGFKY